MSKDWVQDINDMHAKFGVHKWVTEQVQFGEKEKMQESKTNKLVLIIGFIFAAIFIIGTLSEVFK